MGSLVVVSGGLPIILLTPLSISVVAGVIESHQAQKGDQS